MRINDLSHAKWLHKKSLIFFSFFLTWLVSWCFEPGQPQRITSGLKTNFGLSPSSDMVIHANVHMLNKWDVIIIMIIMMIIIWHSITRKLTIYCILLTNEWVTLPTLYVRKCLTQKYTRSYLISYMLNEWVTWINSLKKIFLILLGNTYEWIIYCMSKWRHGNGGFFLWSRPKTRTIF